MHNSSQDPTDVLLDAALESYSNAEPLNGLEDRVLNRINLARPRTGFWHGRNALLAAGATLALSCLMIVTFERRKSEPVAPGISAVRVVSPMPSQIPFEEARPLPFPRKVEVRRRPRMHRLPRREQFPTPEPVTAEERAMVSLVERDPEEAVRVFSALQTNSPLEIPPLEIQPL